MIEQIWPNLWGFQHTWKTRYESVYHFLSDLYFSASSLYVTWSWLASLTARSLSSSACSTRRLASSSCSPSRAMSSRDLRSWISAVSLAFFVLSTSRLFCSSFKARWKVISCCSNCDFNFWYFSASPVSLDLSCSTYFSRAFWGLLDVLPNWPICDVKS